MTCERFSVSHALDFLYKEHQDQSKSAKNLLCLLLETEILHKMLTIDSLWGSFHRVLYQSVCRPICHKVDRQEKATVLRIKTQHPVMHGCPRDGESARGWNCVYKQEQRLDVGLQGFGTEYSCDTGYSDTVLQDRVIQ